MAISSNYPVVQYEITNDDVSRVEFAYNFPLDNIADIVVCDINPALDIADPNHRVVILAASYTVQPAGDDLMNGGNVVLVAPVTVGHVLELSRSTPISQMSVLHNQAQVPPPMLERMADKLTMIAQEHELRFLSSGETINIVNDKVNATQEDLAAEAATRAQNDAALGVLIDNRYTKAQTDAIIQEVKTATYHFVGYISQNSPENPKDGDLWLQGVDSGQPPIAFPIAAQRWNGTGWEAVNYMPANFDLWANRNDNSGYYWFADHWSVIDQDIDLSPYRTAAAQDTLDALKAPLASPTLAGTPTAPTAPTGDSSNQIANTEFVQGAANAVLPSTGTAGQILTRNSSGGAVWADPPVVDYDSVDNKPSINGVELIGDKSSTDLGLSAGGGGGGFDGVHNDLAGRTVANCHPAAAINYGVGTLSEHLNGLISDATPATDKAYSSSKVNAELANRYTKSEMSSLYYSKQDMNDIVNEVKSATYHFVGYVAPATFTDPNVKIGHLLIVASAMPATFPATAMQWNGTAWEDAPDYTPIMFDLWSDRNDDHGYYWFAGTWNQIDQNVDLSAYRTATAQDTIDNGIMDAIDLKADKSGVVDIVSFTITGNGSTTSWTLTHNKNTMTVFTFIYNASTGARIFPGVALTSANVVTITTAAPLASGYVVKVNLLYKP